MLHLDLHKQMIEIGLWFAELVEKPLVYEDLGLDATTTAGLVIQLTDDGDAYLISPLGRLLVCGYPRECKNTILAAIEEQLLATEIDDTSWSIARTPSGVLLPKFEGPICRLDERLDPKDMKRLMIEAAASCPEVARPTADGWAFPDGWDAGDQHTLLVWHYMHALWCSIKYEIGYVSVNDFDASTNYELVPLPSLESRQQESERMGHKLGCRSDPTPTRRLYAVRSQAGPEYSLTLSVVLTRADPMQPAWVCRTVIGQGGRPPTQEEAQVVQELLSGMHYRLNLYNEAA